MIGPTSGEHGEIELVAACQYPPGSTTRIVILVVNVVPQMFISARTLYADSVCANRCSFRS